jgi:hypothetical protein
MFADVAEILLFESLDTPYGEALLFEALWEQLYQGEGPFCFCAPYLPEDCPYRSVLAKLWQQTKPDEDGQHWKLGDPPECIRGYTKATETISPRTNETLVLRPKIWTQNS